LRTLRVAGLARRSHRIPAGSPRRNLSPTAVSERRSHRSLTWPQVSKATTRAPSCHRASRAPSRT
jgi:hypothetical protein